MLSFPPHCSHRLQPLDRSVYGPLKRHINSTNVFLEAEFAPSYVTDHPIPDPALPGPSTTSALPGPSTTSALPGPSTTSALPVRLRYCLGKTATCVYYDDYFSVSFKSC
uniref:Uncharacterized protein n=1 Tax=Haplochromis burtoni TaxID=8153 RepID=A0A3Q2VJV2_HAPBU